MDFFCLETALAFCNNHPTTFSSYLYLIHLISTYPFDLTQSSDLISLKKTLLFFSFIYRPGLEQMLWAPVTWWMVVWGKFDRVLMLQVFSTCLSCHIQQSNLLFLLIIILVLILVLLAISIWFFLIPICYYLKKIWLSSILEECRCLST